MKRIGVILGCLYLLSGCATPIDLAIGIPDRPYLIGLTDKQEKAIEPDSRDIIAADIAELKNHIKRLESRIILHDESL